MRNNFFNRFIEKMYNLFLKKENKHLSNENKSNTGNPLIDKTNLL